MDSGIFLIGCASEGERFVKRRAVVGLRRFSGGDCMKGVVSIAFTSGRVASAWWFGRCEIHFNHKLYYYYHFRSLLYYCKTI